MYFRHEEGGVDRRFVHAFRIVMLSLVLTGCAAEIPRKADASGPIDEVEFRRLFPLDEQRVDAILDDYYRVQSNLMATSVSGAQAIVSLLTANGDFHVGTDVFYSGEVPRIKEVRDNYAAVQVGTMVCVQSPAEKVECRVSDPLRLGLPDVPKAHVARIWSRDIRCIEPDTPCRFIKVQLGSREGDDNSMEGFTADPELVGHDYEMVFRLSDYLPVYLKQTDHYHVGVTMTAFFKYQFGGTVEEVELPPEGGSIVELTVP